MSPERLLKLILRLAGGVMLLAAPAAVMPRGWMAACHRWLGLGAFCDQPIAEYLARTTSGLYAVLGAAFVLTAGDVRRFGPVITLLAACLVPLALVVWGFMLFADRRLGLYMIADVLTAVPFAAVVLALQRRLPPADSPGATPE
jgi:hypothetical protein